MGDGSREVMGLDQERFLEETAGSQVEGKSAPGSGGRAPDCEVCDGVSVPRVA